MGGTRCALCWPISQDARGRQNSRALQILGNNTEHIIVKSFCVGRVNAWARVSRDKTSTSWIIVKSLTVVKFVRILQLGYIANRDSTPFGMVLRCL